MWTKCFLDYSLIFQSNVFRTSICQQKKRGTVLHFLMNLFWFIYSQPKLPDEPSFGWVGRTDYGTTYLPNDRNDDDHLKASYDIYSDYQDDIDERNFYPEHPHQPTSKQQFGFEFARVDENADEGFGQDDLFFNSNTKYVDNEGNERVSVDYDGSGIIMDLDKAVQHIHLSFLSQQ